MPSCFFSPFCRPPSPHGCYSAHQYFQLFEGGGGGGNLPTHLNAPTMSSMEWGTSLRGSMTQTRQLRSSTMTLYRPSLASRQGQYQQALY